MHLQIIIVIVIINIDIWQYFQQMTDKCRIKPDIITINTMIKTFGKGKDIESIMIIINEIIPKFHLKPDEITYNELINIYSNLDNAEMAQTYFHEMIENGIDPDIIVFSSLFNAFGNDKTKTKYNIWWYFEEMVNEYKIRPNIVTINNLIKAFGKRNEIENVLIVWNQVLYQFQLKPNQITFHQMIHIFNNLGDTEMIKKIFNEMIKCGIEPDHISLSILEKSLKLSK